MQRTKLTVYQQRVLLVGVGLSSDNTSGNNSLDELASLVDTIGAKVVDRITQQRTKPDMTYYIGKGKVDEVAELIDQSKIEGEPIDAVIFDNELLPGQVRNLEEALDIKVIDRTELILDIFATHARSQQSKLQVQLAQMEYTLPRLKHLWGHFSRIAGRAMIGRGPGEKQLETDRRLARDHIVKLKRQLQDIQKKREVQTATRSDNFNISLVGYTNAGKSTLMNALTRAGVLVEDKLFSTLDTKTHTWELKSGQKALISDTVGFISHLPHSLVSSFHATLEEVRQADLLLHVVDAASADAANQIKAVNEVLKELDCADKRTLIVFNKIDKADPLELALLQKQAKGITASALKGQGLNLLDEKVSEIINSYQKILNLRVPIGNGKLMAYLYERGQVLEQVVDKDYLKVQVRLGPRDALKAKGMGATEIISPPRRYGRDSAAATQTRRVRRKV